VTGLVMIGYLILHVLGNLQAFLGPEKINGYAAMLHGPLHEVTLLDRAARPVPYAKAAPQASTVASRTLRIGGVVLLLFIVLHLLHFTTGDIHPDFIPGDVYHNLITGLASPLVAGLYLVAMLAVGLHLYHGAWSSFRSLGAVQPREHPRHRPVAAVLAILIWLGFSIIPVAVLAGWIH